MPRLTRVESQARTQAQLVEVATELFLKDGYRSTPLAAVAERAGFSTGAVYSNFASKADLGLAVLDGLRAQALAGLTETVTAAQGGLDERIDALLAWSEHTLGDSAWPQMELEFALESRGDEARVQQLASRQIGIQDLLAGLIEQWQPEGFEPLLPPRHLARVLISIAVGHSMQRLVDPQVTSSSLRRAVHALLAAPARH